MDKNNLKRLFSFFDSKILLAKTQLRKKTQSELYNWIESPEPRDYLYFLHFSDGLI